MENKFNLLKENEVKYAEIIVNSKREAEDILKEGQKKIANIESEYRVELEKERKHLYSKGEQKIKKLIDEIDSENKKELEQISKIKSDILEKASDIALKEVFDV